MNITIIGAGIAGLTLANRLRHYGHSVRIIEKSPGPRTEGYMMDFFGAGYDAAEKMGLLRELESIHYPIKCLQIMKPDGRTKFSMEYVILRELLKNRHYNFMRGDLERILYNHIRDEIEIQFGTRVASIKQGNAQVQVELSDASSHTCDLLVGADGLHSQVRSLVFGGEENYVRFMGYYTAAFTVDASELSTNFSDMFCTLTVPKRQVSVYPIRGGKMASFFLYSSPRINHRVSHEEALVRLKENSGEMQWIVPELLHAGMSASDFYFDEVSQVEMPTWSQGRVVLVGDACQCVSLIAGQGSSMAMAGTYTLARCLEEAGDNVEKALVAYEQGLKPQIAMLQKSARRFGQYFMPDTEWHMFLRDLTMRASVAPVIRKFVRFQSARLPK